MRSSKGIGGFILEEILGYIGSTIGAWKGGSIVSVILSSIIKESSLLFKHYSSFSSYIYLKVMRQKNKKKLH